MTEADEAWVRFFNWEGDACRLHLHANGAMTADLYRAGKGVVPILISDVLDGAREINEEDYKDLVQEEIALHRRRKERKE